MVHRRGGYRDPESQAFIESWFSKLKERCIWREEFETLDQARPAIGAYVERYHHRPHSSLNLLLVCEPCVTRDVTALVELWFAPTEHSIGWQ